MKLLLAGLIMSLPGLAVITKAAEDCSLEVVQDLPDSYLIGEGMCPIRLSIEVVGTEPISYQWQVRAPGHNEFQDVTDATNSFFYTYRMELTLDGTAYRAQVRNGCGEVHYSTELTTWICCTAPYEPRVVMASAYATNRIFVAFDQPVIAAGEPFAALDFGRQIQAIVTNDFDSKMIEIIVDPSTPLETGVDYLLQVGNFMGLSPLPDRLDPDPTSISVRLDPFGDQLVIEGLRVIPPLRQTICPGGCYDILVRPRYIIWETNDLLQYATDLGGPWIDLPSARYGHPMIPRQPYYLDYCAPYTVPSQLFFRLVPSEPSQTGQATVTRLD